MKKNIPQDPNPKRRPIWYLHSLQRLFFVVGVSLLAYACLHSIVTLEGDNFYFPRVHYILDQFIREGQTRFEDSWQFDAMLEESINEVLEFTTICAQLETDGHFDGEKIIDVGAFANRREGLPPDYLSAEYYLNDLLRWQRQGFSYEVRMMDDAEAAAFFGGDETSDPAALMLDTVEYLIQVDEADEAERIDMPRRYSLLINLYQTVEGKNVEDYVTNFSDYNGLVESIIRAANDLRLNQGRYEDYYTKYRRGNTNVHYVLRQSTDGVTTIYTNTLPDWTDTSITAIDELFRAECEEFAYYNSLNFEFITTTGLHPSSIAQAMLPYQYAYPDDVQIWVGIDTDYAGSQTDAYAKLGAAYTYFFAVCLRYILSAIVCLILSLALIAPLCSLTGRAVDGQGQRITLLRRFDHIYTEIWLLFFAIVLVATIAGGAFYAEAITEPYSYPAARSVWFRLPLIVSAYMYLMSLLMSLAFYGFVRRIKCRTLWADSLLIRCMGLIKKCFCFIGRVFGRVRRAYRYAYDNAPLLARFVLPAAAFAFILIILIITTAAGGGYRAEAAFITIVFALGVSGAAAGYLYKSAKARQDIVSGIGKISGGELKHKVDVQGLRSENLLLAEAVNAIGDSIAKAVEISLKDERMKADLITNVSHDIKTPLTSLITYIDLLRRENIADETVKNYIDILDKKAQRLKQLTDDLVEASKISSGNISYQMERINLTELLKQSLAEMAEKFAERNLSLNINSDEKDLSIEADSRMMWRVLENLLTNVQKYAMAATRVYIELTKNAVGEAVLTIKNISEQPLGYSAEELAERFIRGDVSRSTEGSGLGISIAKSLTEAQNGRFEIVMDGDLFKVMLTYPAR